MINAPKPSLSRETFCRLGAELLIGGSLGLSGVGCGGVNSLAAATPQTDEGTSAKGQTAQAALVTVARSTFKGSVPPNLAGLSYEKSKLSTHFFSATNANLIGCFKRLGVSILRVGGSSVDTTTWEPDGAGATYGQVAAPDIDALAAFVKSTHWQVIYGINLASNTPVVAAAEAAYAANALGSSLLGFEIGNECDYYSTNGKRPATYTISDFIAEWSAYAAAIRSEVPTAPLTGPASFGHVSSWTIPFASSEGANIELLTQHYYRGDGASPTATMPLLLSADSSLPNELTQLKTAAASYGIRGGYRLDEANSFWGGGAPNVSNAYGSALWTIDFLLINAQYGSSGVNFHGGGSGSYNPYYAPIDDTGAGVVGIMPEFYGMLLVQHIVPGPMYSVNVSTSLLLTAYAVAGKDAITYVVIVNKEAETSAATTIDLGDSASSATALVLSGSGLGALSGTTLGGAVVAKDGSWSPSLGKPIELHGATLEITVQPATAILLSIT